MCLNLSLQVMSSLPSSATWENPQCLGIMFVTSKRRAGELNTVSLDHIHSNSLIVNMTADQNETLACSSQKYLVLLGVFFFPSTHLRKMIFSKILLLLMLLLHSFCHHKSENKLFKITDWMEKINSPHFCHPHSSQFWKKSHFEIERIFQSKKQNKTCCHQMFLLLAGGSSTTTTKCVCQKGLQKTWATSTFTIDCQAVKVALPPPSPPCNL